jgi:plastocyanin
VEAGLVDPACSGHYPHVLDGSPDALIRRLLIPQLLRVKRICFMNTIKRTQLIKNCSSIALFLLLSMSTDICATTHIVQFGGTVGFAYSPKTFSASVGDTVKWQGDFTMHPISSTSVPATAATWHNASGAVFTYVIAVPGTYQYHCDVHASFGMTGSFSANPAGVENGHSYSRTEHNRYPVTSVTKSTGKASRIFILQSDPNTSALIDLSGQIRH